MAFTYQTMGYSLHECTSVFPVMARQISEILSTLFFAYIAV